MSPLVGDGVPTTTVGAMLSTVTADEAEEAALGLPERLLATPAPTVIEISPLPAQLDNVTEGVAVVPLVTTGELQEPPPESLTVISPL